ncbi:arylsulfatase [Tichowtungia aerotolerans]|uniref:Sulfatase-like hydrolase/transferase n=1 Tax=Tichowtungia aerotolerans TaxID=2697043 RepID=A0A6P1M9T3_9BACT|nr:arylsulfatase [Tichowtungia aerotolerans]QHI68848.1 sulfatase-like hydrolase/transferase [Tichowtungia aerotolerans]
MTRKYAGCFLAGLLVGSLLALGEQTEPKPNIVLILADDLGFSDLGCYGGEIRTPNLDSLAANGLRFTQAYSCARCWPSRASILSGYYPNQICRDLLPLPGSKRTDRPEWAELLPRYLETAGYRSCFSGKWHIDGSPLEEGFEHTYLLDDHDRYFSPKVHEENGHHLPPVERGSGFYVTTAIADHAIGHLKEHAERSPDRPFFEYVAFTAPHFPLHALPEDIARYKGKYDDGWDEVRAERYERIKKLGIVQGGLSPRDPELRCPPGSLSAEKLREMIGPQEINRAVAWDDLTDEQKKFQAQKMEVHAAMVDRMDQEIGRIIQQLKEMGCYENTLILFASDNGASSEQLIRGDGHDSSAPVGSASSYLGLGPGWASVANTPFRLYKMWTHEGGVSSPLIAHWPNGISDKGTLRRFPCHFVDIVPTFLQLAGSSSAPSAEAPSFLGQSLVPVFATDREKRSGNIWWYHQGNRALRSGDWKLVAEAGRPWELYNLGADRSETDNLIRLYPERAAAMQAEWEKTMKQFGQDAGIKPPGEIVAVDGVYVFEGTQYARLTDILPITPENSMVWKMEVNISRESAPGSILMGNRRTAEEATSFMKITPERGIQIYDKGRQLMRLPFVFPREEWVSVELIKTGLDFTLYVNGDKAGSARCLDSVSEAFPCYLGGDPFVGEYAQCSIRCVRVGFGMD